MFCDSVFGVCLFFVCCCVSCLAVVVRCLVFVVGYVLLAFNCRVFVVCCLLFFLLGEGGGVFVVCCLLPFDVRLCGLLIDVSFLLVACCFVV